MTRFLILALLILPGSVSAAEAALFIEPETGAYTIGEIFEIRVYADTDGAEVNAAEAELTFNPDAIEIQKVSTDGSILDAWPTQPTFSNQTGTLRFAGWTKSPYRGSRGLLVTVQFKALRSRPSNAYLAAGAILAADGKGSNIITSMRSGLYTVSPREEGPVPELSEATSTEEAYEAYIEDAPPAPVFDPHPGVVEVGERIIVTGVAAPSTKIIFLFGEGEEAETTALTTDQDGAFMFVSNMSARPGVYRLRAMTENQNGKMSEAARLTIIARSHGLASALAVSADVASTLLPILLLLVLGGLGAGYLYHIHSIEKAKHARLRE